MNKVEHRLYACSRCGKRQPGITMIHSRWSGNRYCRDIKVCDRRLKRAAA